jgi:mRNA-degrading endonuclease RelE of RelBE toxin-antitoxin system
MHWTVHIHDAAARQLEAMPPDRRRRVLDDIAAFEENPFRGLVKPLKGKENKGRYRKVSGRYRIIFQTYSRHQHRGRACHPPAQREDLPIDDPSTSRVLVCN